ncbi:unnamed protein product [Nezara viridula]|nr:unnamed protein product [Nezara viridula]
MEGVDNNLALAADVFDQFCSATTLRSVLGHFRYLCDLLQIRPTNFNHFYPKLKAKLRSWKAQALWNKFDKRFSHKCYNRGKICSNLRVLVIGAGPCGLRSAIEAQLLGAKVVVVEKRDRITRNNVLHLWPFVIHDLRALGAKKFFGRFCAGAIDHISIRQLQCILLKVSCLLGIEIHEGVGFESLIPPHQDPQTNEMVGWRAATSPADHPVSQYEFNALIGADGKRNTLDGFKRKEFRGKLAIAITANFINRHSEAEARVEEISGVAFIFNQKFFKELTAETGIDLENIVYYKDDTHYFVMTAKKHSLIDKGVILNDCQDTAKLLSPENVDKGALMEYAREAADFSTNGQLPCLEFAVNHYGQPDVAMFDFTSMYAAENASRMAEVAGHRLFITLVGDSLLEPFWPTGSGCARGFLSSMDACWALRSWSLGAHPLEVLAERESIYRLLGQTTPENLQRDLQSYTLDPHTRYPNLNIRSVIPIQVRNLFTTDDPEAVDKFLKQPVNVHLPARDDHPKKKRKRECHPETLLHWLKRQIHHYESVPKVEDVTSSFKSGLALCAIIHRYRPHLIDFSSLNPEEVAKNNQLAFDILEREAAIPPVMTGEEMAECVIPDRLTMLSYLSQVYEAFRGEIPHIKHPKLEETEDEKHHITHSREPRIRSHLTTAHKISLLGKLTSKTPKKRRSHLGADRENRPLDQIRKAGATDEDFTGRVKDLEAKLRGTHSDKKPKDLLRAIGKIEKSDWNVKQIEKKMEENRMGRGLIAQKSEKVPKWSKQQFEDKFTLVEKKLRAKSNDAGLNEKYSKIDDKMKSLERRIKDGIKLEQGPRGSNKVSAMAAHLATINKQPEPQIIQTGKPAVVGGSGGSEMCHFCNKRVYLMERLSAEGRFFHRGCFRCQYCSTSLRLGNYAFDREGKYGSKFYCVQHFGLQGSIGRRLKEDTKTEILKTPIKTEKSLESELIPVETVDIGTPERAEFENLSDCVEVEEDEWSDRNFLPSATDTEASQDSSSSSSSEGYAEAEDGGLDPEETLRLAQDWTRRYASSHYSNSEDETTDSDTEEEAKKDTSPRQHVSDSGSETEVPSEDEYSSSSSEDENSATEISTDSEFEHDGTTHTIPDIVISETVQVRKGLIEAPRQVQLISRQVNGKITPHSGDLKLELKRIDEPKPTTPNNNINNNDRPRPFINPNRGDYLLNRTQSTEGIASKISLELKKKYLLGPSGMPGNIRKSGSAITLDTKFKSLIDQISEQQKLLNPAPVPSPTMQAFLQGADKLKTSPVLLEKKILPLKDFKHICSLGSKEDKKDGEKEIKEEKKEEEEVRSRSPVHETSIVVPEFPRTEQKEIESDSLSSDMSSSEEEDSAESEGEGNPVSPPKLEIHNSRGELMEEEVQLDSLNIPDVCQAAEPKRQELRDKLDLVPSTETGFAKVITVPSNETNGQVLKQVSTPAELFVTKEEVHSDASSPPSPSLKDDITLGLTETELSDWARDEDGVVSETFDDLEYNINPQTISYKKHLTPRSRRNARGTAPKIARTEEFDDEFTHVCGKDKPTNLHNVENLEFMDTADESSDEDSGAVNKILNRGYIQFINSEDDDLPTPIVEAVNYCLETKAESKEDLDSRIGESTDTTTTSEPTTIKDSPIEPPAHVVESDSQDKINQEYEIYVQKMQGKISPFGNVRNSIDVRKSRKINKRSPPDSLESVGAVEAPAITTIEEVIPKQISIPVKKDDVKEEPPPTPQPQSLTPKLGLNSPTTHRKLEQLNQERVKQKDLIHEMVMNRLIAQGKSPTERKQRRSIRTVLRSSDTPPAPVPKERPKSEMFVTPAAPPPIRERAFTVTTARRLAAKTNVIASSLPDIHKACSTPGLPSELTVPNLRGMREQARAKFKMMSDEELGLSPEDKIKKFKLKIQKHLHEAKLPSPTHCEKTEINKKSKEERKRSIIQAVSDFFLKKSPTPPKTPSSHSPTKSIPSVSSKKDKDAPPIPPPPVSYNPSQVVDDSQSEEETQSCTFAGMDSLQRKSKQNRRQVRQAQSKRLRMAQEVQRELEELEVKQKELEAKGVAVEKALRGEETGVNGSESELLGEWLRLMRERSEARSKEKQLVIRGQEIELEHRHARLQAQLSELMAASPEGTKTNEEVALEGRILREMLEIVERRNSLQAQLEAEKERYCEEEKDLEAQMLAKGIQFQQPKQ